MQTAPRQTVAMLAADLPFGVSETGRYCDDDAKNERSTTRWAHQFDLVGPLGISPDGPLTANWLSQSYGDDAIIRAYMEVEVSLHARAHCQR